MPFHLHLFAAGLVAAGRFAGVEMKASSLYRAEFWRVGIFAGKHLPPNVSIGIVRALANLYCRLSRRRREVVVKNLLPALNGNRAEAERLSTELFANFAQKLVDLWRYESGQSIETLISETSGLEHLEKASDDKRGTLLLTPHLGNWEFGAPLLAKRGIHLLAVTLDEPDSRLTELRKNSRARWGIETLVIGNDPFAGVEIVRRLEGGATVALLIDRPPRSSATNVELFGQPFPASVSPAELARATGCRLLPVYLPRLRTGYGAYSMPEITYDRAALRQLDARRDLIQKIMRAFEPVIREHLNQWYHFVPIWPD